MDNKEKLLTRIKTTVKQTDPDAVLILYGSYARGDFTEKSDIDLLILIDQQEVSRKDQKRIKYPLYDLEFETGILISPLVLSKQDWHTKHRQTPFYENISLEGQVL